MATSRSPAGTAADTAVRALRFLDSWGRFEDAHGFPSTILVLSRREMKRGVTCSRFANVSLCGSCFGLIWILVVCGNFQNRNFTSHCSCLGSKPLCNFWKSMINYIGCAYWKANGKIGFVNNVYNLITDSGRAVGKTKNLINNLVTTVNVQTLQLDFIPKFKFFVNSTILR